MSSPPQSRNPQSTQNDPAGEEEDTALDWASIRRSVRQEIYFSAERILYDLKRLLPRTASLERAQLGYMCLATKRICYPTADVEWIKQSETGLEWLLADPTGLNFCEVILRGFFSEISPQMDALLLRFKQVDLNRIRDNWQGVFEHTRKHYPITQAEPPGPLVDTVEGASTAITDDARMQTTGKSCRDDSIVDRTASIQSAESGLIEGNRSVFHRLGAALRIFGRRTHSLDKTTVHQPRNTVSEQQTVMRRNTYVIEADSTPNTPTIMSPGFPPSIYGTDDDSSSEKVPSVPEILIGPGSLISPRSSRLSGWNSKCKSMSARSSGFSGK
jgi:hypothetical protein